MVKSGLKALFFISIGVSLFSSGSCKRNENVGQSNDSFAARELSEVNEPVNSTGEPKSDHGVKNNLLGLVPPVVLEQKIGGGSQGSTKKSSTGNKDDDDSHDCEDIEPGIPDCADPDCDGGECDDLQPCTENDRCEDDVCVGDFNSSLARAEDCSNGLDDDCDGLPDFQDNDCYRMIFVSSDRYLGDFSDPDVPDNCKDGEVGRERADCVCQALATNSSLPHVQTARFISWLSITGSDATSPGRVVDTGAGYIRVDQSTIIANDHADLLDGSIDNDINTNENGVIAAGGNSSPRTWTATSSAGTLKLPNCNDWTVGNVRLPNAQTGNRFQSDAQWTDITDGTSDDLSRCNGMRRIYCVEVPVVQP